MNSSPTFRRNVALAAALVVAFCLGAISGSQGNLGLGSGLHERSVSGNDLALLRLLSFHVSIYRYIDIPSNDRVDEYVEFYPDGYLVRSR